MDISIELAYQAGRSAYANGYAKDANPWPMHTPRADAWNEGWQDAHGEYEEACCDALFEDNGQWDDWMSAYDYD